jgi:ABC-type molybdate transport system substrate-binding protein
VYVTDSKSFAARVRVVPLPAWAQPPIRYEIAVVKASSHRAAARTFVKRVLSKRGRALLQRAGFGLPKR